jgi:PKD repeat protein
VIFDSRASNLVPGDTNDRDDTFVYDRQTRQVRRVSVAPDGTQGINGVDNINGPAISADGRWVAFGSWADNLVSKDTNNTEDVFVSNWDLQGVTVQADFSAVLPLGVDTLTVTFTNQTTGDFTTSLWFFGDGETSTLSSPTHTYTAPGMYDVMLLVSGSGGTDTLTRPVYVVVRGPLSHYLPLVRH